MIRTLYVLAPMLALSGCLTTSEEFQDMLAMVADEDQDGFYARDDCDDFNAQVNPSVAEVAYDGLDNDCDPETRDDDFDRDGYLLVDDCDDSDPSSYVGAEEGCDNADNDCDGVVDEGVLREFYYDGDDDGYGDSSRPVEACAESETHVAYGGDCDDADGDVNPGAEEICNDGLDNNCDNVGCQLAAEEAVLDSGHRLEGEAHAVNFGIGVDAGDGLVIVGSWHDSVTASRAGSARVFEGADFEQVGSVRGDGPDQNLGREVAYSGRLGRLGEAIIVGAPGYAEGGASGAVFILDVAAEEQRPADARVEILGSTNLTGPLVLLDSASSHTLAVQEHDGGAGRICLFEDLIDGSLQLSDADRCFARDADDALGASMFAADLDGDGLDELLASASGGEEVLVIPQDTTDLAGVLSLSGAGEPIGAALTAGDMDGDGRPEVAVSYTEWEGVRGQVWLFSGGFRNSQNVQDAGATIVDLDDQGAFGWALSLESDLDGDGRAELAISEPQGSEGGGVHLFLTPITGSLSPEDADTRILPEGLSDGLGRSLSGGADLDGEGPQDLLIGAPNYGGGGDRPGAAYLWFGRGL